LVGIADHGLPVRSVNPAKWVGRLGGSPSGAHAALKARFARGAAGAFSIKIAGTAISFLAQLVLARVLGVESYGVYAYVLAWTTLLALLATLGFQQGLLRFVSAYVAQEKWGLARGVARYAQTRAVMAGAAVTAVGTALIVGFEDHLPTELENAWLFGLIMVPVLALLHVRASLLRAFGKVLAALAPNLLWRHMFVLIGVGTLGIIHPGDVRAPLAMAVMLGGTVVSLAIASWLLRGARPEAMASIPVAEERPVWLSATRFMLLIAAAQVLMERADVLLLGWFAGTTEAGIYSIAHRIAMLVTFVLTAVNIIFAPTAAALYAQGDRSGLQTLVTMTAWWITGSALAIALPFLVLTGFWLGLFGDAFVAGSSALRILIVGQLISAMAGSVGYLMMMTGQERQAALIILGATAANLVLNLLLIPLFGMEGAAIANAATLAAWNVAMAIFIWRKLDVVPSILGSLRGAPAMQ
jgi:O-antigen/teichoic acid export membrane protein